MPAAAIGYRQRQVTFFTAHPTHLSCPAKLQSKLRWSSSEGDGEEKIGAAWGGAAALAPPTLRRTGSGGSRAGAMPWRLAILHCLLLAAALTALAMLQPCGAHLYLPQRARDLAEVTAAVEAQPAPAAPGPANASQPGLFLFIGVLSGAQFTARRDAVRAAWANAANRDIDVSPAVGGGQVGRKSVSSKPFPLPPA